MFQIEIKSISNSTGKVPSSFRKQQIETQNFNSALKSAESKPRGKRENQFDHIFAAAGERWNIPPQVLKAIAKAESNFNPNAKSGAGAQGMMQLMPATARSLGVKDPFDPAENIFAGARYFRSMLDRFDGNLELALAGYNAGPGNVKKFHGIPPFRETQNYVKKIMASLGEAGTLDVETRTVDGSTVNSSSPNPGNDDIEENLQLAQMIKLWSEIKLARTALLWDEETADQKIGL